MTRIPIYSVPFILQVELSTAKKELKSVKKFCDLSALSSLVKNKNLTKIERDAVKKVSQDLVVLILQLWNFSCLYSG